MSTQNVPAQIVRGATLTYRLKARTSQGAEVKKAVEIIKGVTGSEAMAFRSLAGVSPGSNADTTYEFSCEHFTHPASQIRIEIQALVTRNKVTTVTVCQSAPINVVNS
jgi:hypothetical protein